MLALKEIRVGHKAMMPDNMKIRPMTREELDVLVEWAAREGWNPRLGGCRSFFLATDSEGFVAAEIEGELIGGGSIVVYEQKYGFMGFFMVLPEYRGHGLGDHLWHERKRRLVARLDADAAIGLDGVFNMQDYYSRGGFRFVCRDLRFEGSGMNLPQPTNVIEASTLPIEQIEAYDRRHFPAARRKFLQAWIHCPGGSALAVLIAARYAATR